METILYIVVAIIAIAILLLIRAEYIIIFITAYMTIEPFINGLLSGYPFLIGKYYIDIIIPILVGKAIFTRKITGEVKAKSGISFAIIFLLVIWAISTYINEVPAIPSLVALRTVGRFVLLYLAILNLNLSKSFTQRVVNILLIAGFIQVSLAAAQYVYPDLQELMQPPEQNVEFGVPIAGDSTIGGHARLFGTMGRYNALGFFLSMLFCISLAFYVNCPLVRKQRYYFVASMVFFLFTALTTSRAAFGTCMLAFVVIPTYAKIKRWLLLIPVIIIISLSVTYVFHGATEFAKAESEKETTIGDRLLGVISEQYVEKEISEGRFYVITEGIMQIFAAHPLFGIGPGTIGSAVTDYYELTDSARKINITEGVFLIWGDIGWATYVAQIGLLGALAIIFIFGKLYYITSHSLKVSASWHQKALNQAYLPFLIAFVLLWMSTSNALEGRISSYLFWFFTAIMVLSNTNLEESPSINES